MIDWNPYCLNTTQIVIAIVNVTNFNQIPIGISVPLKYNIKNLFRSFNRFQNFKRFVDPAVINESISIITCNNFMSIVSELLSCEVIVLKISKFVNAVKILGGYLNSNEFLEES